MRLQDSSLISDTDLVAYYKHDNSALITDSKGSRTLTNNGTVADGTGKYGGAADGGSSNSTKSLTYTTDNYGLTSSAAFSIGCWGNVTTAPATNETQTIMSLSTGTSTNAYTAYMGYRDSSSTKQVYVTSYGEHGATDTYTYNTTLTPGTWYFFVVTDNGTTIKLYLNGSEIISQPRDSNTFNWGLVGLSLLARGGDFYWKGLVDDSFVFKDVLTPTEITNIYAELSSGAMFFSML